MKVSNATAALKPEPVKPDLVKTAGDKAGAPLPIAAAPVNETPAQLQVEASHGNQRAIRLLAKHAHHATTANPSPPGTGKLVKVTA
jgi:hypothetical protein